MVKLSFLAAFAGPVLATALSTSAFAADPAKGEKDFRSCKACHTIANGDDVILRGGKVGPNLYGVVGRQAGSSAEFKYGDDLIAAGEAGLVWTEELLVSFVTDPKAFLSEQLETRAKSKMTFKKKDASDIIAFLASVAPQPEPIAETPDTQTPDTAALDSSSATEGETSPQTAQ